MFTLKTRQSVVITEMFGDVVRDLTFSFETEKSRVLICEESFGCKLRNLSIENASIVLCSAMLD